jgi:hypothetical protein
MTPTRAAEQLVMPQWDAFCGEGFKRLCREALPLIYDAERIASKFQIGEYWDRATQLDVVGLRTDGWIDLGECKWGPRDSIAAAVGDLKSRHARYPAEGRTLRYHLLTRRASRAEIGDTEVHTLNALYDDE